VPLDDIITLEVGEDENLTRLAVHKTVLCSSSPFFEAACKPEWMKAEDRVIKLPVDDPVAVKAMVCWMYHNIICISSEMDGHEESDTKDDAMKTPYGLFAKLFVLGEEYQMPRLRNHAIDAIIHRSEEDSFAIRINPYVYADTCDDSLLRKVLVRLALHLYDKALISRAKNELCGGFIFDLALVSFDYLENQEESRTIDCSSPAIGFCGNYHAHTENSSGKCKVLKKYRVDS